MELVLVRRLPMLTVPRHYDVVGAEHLHLVSRSRARLGGDRTFAVNDDARAQPGLVDRPKTCVLGILPLLEGCQKAVRTWRVCSTVGVPSMWSPMSSRQRVNAGELRNPTMWPSMLFQATVSR